MSTEPELVVLVDDEGNPTGSVEKFAVHTTATPLHLAFSCHVYNDRGQVLVTRRALSKITWPGVWTNSFCGHPAPGEMLDDAIARRALVELGITVSKIQPLLPGFRYRAVDASGIVENEICPVFKAVTTDDIDANPEEVSEWKWVDPESLHSAVSAAPYAFSPWIALQFEELST